MNYEIWKENIKFVFIIMGSMFFLMGFTLGFYVQSNDSVDILNNVENADQIKNATHVMKRSDVVVKYLETDEDVDYARKNITNPLEASTCVKGGIFVPNSLTQDFFCRKIEENKLIKIKQ